MNPPVKMLLIYVDESDIWGDAHSRLYEAIVRRMRQPLQLQLLDSNAARRLTTSVFQSAIVFARRPASSAASVA